MRFLITTFLFLLYSSAWADTVDGKVTAERLNVRVFPGLGYTCVCVLEKNDIVKILGRSGDWYQIEAPPASAVWVSNSFIDGSEILKDAKFRAGPSVAYEFYDKASSDINFEGVGEPELFWTKIKPPLEPQLKAWVNSKFVSINKQDSVNIAAIQNLSDVPEDNKTPLIEKTPMKKMSNELNFIEGFPKTVATDGILLPLEKTESIITHSIDIKVNGDLYIIAYAYSLNDNLKLWEKRKVRINGVQRWVKDWKRPVIEIEKISPVWQ